MDIQIIYYLLLLLIFGYFMVFHFQRMTTIPSSSPPSLDPAQTNELVNEIDIDSFYHHPSWPQRWSHPELTGKYKKRWVKEPWFKDNNRQPKRFISKLLPFQLPWGYVIYRTVYTAESDELWPIALDKLAKMRNYCIDADLHATIRHKKPKDPEPDSNAERLVKETYKDVIFSNKKYWDGADIEKIRQHFAEYLDASKGRGYRFEGCLMIDEPSLKSIAATVIPEPWLGGRGSQTPDPPQGYVNMIDGRYTGNESRYSGFMCVEIGPLWWLYLNLKWSTMSQVCPTVPEGLIPIYDGGDGKAQDEEGNFHQMPIDRDVR
ncbi:hypothetical protein N7504_006697 [Penicillium tannophilum]|nr:hypothetical protein N7504_006697 [Penicillium tannophilum]